MPGHRTRQLGWLATIVIATLVIFAVDAPSAYAGDDVNAQLGQPTNAEAGKHLTQGNSFYKIGEFEKAIEEYKAGALIEGVGVFQFNLAQAYRQLANYERSIFHYKRFIAMRKPTGELRKTIDGFIETMQAELDKAASRQEPTGPGPVTSDAPIQSTEPTQNSMNEEATPSASMFTTRRKVALGVGAVGLAGIGVGIVFGLKANGNKSDAEDICPTEICDRAEEANELLREGQDNALYANIAFGVGAAAIVGAAVLWFTGGPSSTTTAIVPRVTNSYAGLGFETRF